KASPGLHILAVHIPLNACNVCKETGYEMFDRAIHSNKKYDKIFLQDRPKDSYIVR
ncbi:MAG: histone deacetylase, partial [Desulfamplus sp.]|nr:histone deacetylase [Desulfamplus sp.]